MQATARKASVDSSTGRIRNRLIRDHSPNFATPRISMTEEPPRRKLAVLRGCDIWRDGGSYSAVFTTTRGEPYKLWLESHPSVLFQPESLPRHRHLFEGWGDYDRPAPDLRHGVPVLTGSLDEQDIIRQLEAFLIAPVVDIPFAHNTPGEHFISILRDMTASIPLRAPCFAGDVLP